MKEQSYEIYTTNGRFFTKDKVFLEKLSKNEIKEGFSVYADEHGLPVIININKIVLIRKA